jgi:hypothetical protein
MFTRLSLASAIPTSRRRWRPRPPSIGALVARVSEMYDRSIVIDQRVNTAREQMLVRYRYGHGRHPRRTDA